MAEAQANRVEVWPRHWHAWQVFLFLGSQWRMVGGVDRAAVRTGLDYGQVDLAKRHVRVPRGCRQPRRELMQQLRVLEARALRALADDE